MRFAMTAFLALVLPVAAQAESINVLVQRPSQLPDVYALPTLSVERFSGTDGRALANAISRELEQLRDLDGAPLFGLFVSGAAEGSVTGGADVNVTERRFTEKRKRCPGTDDPKAKCDDSAKIEVEVRCRARTVSLDADIGIVRNHDGRILLSRDVSQRDEDRWCIGDSKPADEQAVVNSLIRRAGGAAVAGFAPFSQTQAIRIREDRKGLSKPLADQFRKAVKATRGDGRDGCALFAAMEPLAPTHAALIFNLALCHEATGENELAIEGYRRLDDRLASAALFRAAQTIDAAVQAQARARE
jgi:hypothetical protein